MSICPCTNFYTLLYKLVDARCLDTCITVNGLCTETSGTARARFTTRLHNAVQAQNSHNATQLYRYATEANSYIALWSSRPDKQRALGALEPMQLRKVLSQADMREISIIA